MMRAQEAKASQIGAHSLQLLGLVAFRQFVDEFVQVAVQHLVKRWTVLLMRWSVATLGSYRCDLSLRSPLPIWLRRAAMLFQPPLFLKRIQLRAQMRMALSRFCSWLFRPGTKRRCRSTWVGTPNRSARSAAYPLREMSMRMSRMISTSTSSASQHSNCRAGMDAPGPVTEHAAMHAGFVLSRLWRPCAAAKITSFSPPMPISLLLNISILPMVSAQREYVRKARRQKRCLVPSCRRDLDDHVLVVVRILGGRRSFMRCSRLSRRPRFIAPSAASS